MNTVFYSWGSILITVLSGMAYSDILVFGTLENLIKQKGENAVITQAEISLASGVTPRTTRDCLDRLEDAGRIKRDFTPRIGCTYRIVNGTTSRNDRAAS